MNEIPQEVFESFILLRLPPPTLCLMLQTNKSWYKKCYRNKQYWEYAVVHFLWQRHYILEEPLPFHEIKRFIPELHGFTKQEMIDKYIQEFEPHLKGFRNDAIIKEELWKRRLYLHRSPIAQNAIEKAGEKYMKMGWAPHCWKHTVWRTYIPAFVADAPREDENLDKFYKKVDKQYDIKRFQVNKYFVW